MLAVVEEEMQIEIKLHDFQTEVRHVTREPQLQTRYWSEMSTSSRTWRFPLWLNIHDLFNHPVREVMLLAPGRIFIRLDPIRRDDPQ